MTNLKHEKERKKKWLVNTYISYCSNHDRLVVVGHSIYFSNTIRFLSHWKSHEEVCFSHTLWKKKKKTQFYIKYLII